MRILFTGCSTGFGKYIVEKLREQGHLVCGAGVGGPDIQAVFDSNFNSVHADNIIRDANDFFMRREGSKLLGVDVLVNNAGMTHVEPIERHSPQAFKDVLACNLTAPFLLSQKFLDFLPEGIVGRIVNTTSMAASMALRHSPGYCASKAGLESLTKQMAKELAGKRPVTVLAIAPGTIKGTKMAGQVIESLMSVRGMSREEAEAYSISGSPLGRPCTWDELWKVYDFAINHAPEYMTGSIIHMPGGMGI